MYVCMYVFGIIYSGAYNKVNVNINKKCMYVCMCQCVRMSINKTQFSSVKNKK